MLGVLLLGMQLAATATPAADLLTVKDANRTLRVPLVQTSSGPMIRPRALNPVIRAEARRAGGDEWVITLNGVSVSARSGVPYVWVGTDVRRLAVSPTEKDGELLVPVQFVAEAIPYFVGNGIMWDSARFELRAFAVVTREADRLADQAPAAALSRGAGQGRAAVAPTRTTVGGAAGSATAPVPASGIRRRVVVDAGHGGPDGGMTGPIGGGAFRIQEKDITLQVAKRVGARLRASGVDVVYTRTTDTLIALADRGRIANDARADLFVSIHVNAANPRWSSPGGARGFETYFLAEARTEDARRVEQMENESIRFETTVEAEKGDPLSFIVADMLQNQHLRESSELAETIQRRVGLVHPGPNRGVKQAGFRVLLAAFMPSVLVELGFGSNPAEARYMASPEGQEELASAIAAATIEYLDAYHRRVAGGVTD
jgi:N-acetylmuramoyl-L-alanine amidase